jgi:outer membrane cobalamin receptor
MKKRPFRSESVPFRIEPSGQKEFECAQMRVGPKTRGTLSGLFNFFIFYLLFFILFCSGEIRSQDLPTYELKPIVVTASRSHDRLKNIPSHTTIITRKEWKDKNLLTLGDVLRKYSGLDIKENGFLGQSSSLSLRGSSSSQVLVLLDGRKLNSITYGSFNLSDFSLEQVEKIEIIRGALSNLYGANALGGIVNIVTKDPQSSPFLSGSIIFGTFRTSSYSFNLSQKISKFSFSLGGDRKSSENDRPNSDFYSFDFSGNLGYTFSSKGNFKLYFKTREDRLGVCGPIPDPKKIPKYGNSSVSSLFDHQKDKNHSVDFTFDYPLRKNDFLTFKLYYDQRKLYYFTIYDSWDFLNSSLVKTNDDYFYKTRTSGGFLQYLFSFDNGDNITFGCDFQKDKLFADQNMVYQLPSSLKDTVISWRPKSDLIGIWAKSNIYFIHNLIFQAGLRYDNPSNFSEALSPNLGLVYHPKENQSLKISWGKGFRAPTFNDLYWPYGGNKSLRPEKGQNLEALFSSDGQRFSYQLCLFHRRVKDLITWLPLGEGGQWQPFNVDEYRSWGAEWEMNLVLQKDVNLSWNYTLNMGKETKKELVYDYYDWSNQTEITKFAKSDRDARFVPKQAFNLDLNWKIRQTSQANLSFQYTGERINYYADEDYSDPNVYYLKKKIPSSVLINLSFNHYLNKNLQFIFRLENLLDVRTPTQFGNSLKDKDYPSPKRNINVSWRFDL